MGLSGFCFLSLHPNYLFCYCHYNPEHSLLNRFIPYFWSLDDFVCVCCFKLQDLVNLFEVSLACKKPCRIGLVMCFSESDCCEKPCTGMHNNQLIGSSCCHQQKCTTNSLFSLFHPLQSSFSFLNQNQVSKMSLKKKAFLGCAFLIQGIRRKAVINTGCLCVWPREWGVEPAWMVSTVEWLWMVFLGYTAVLGFRYLRKLWERDRETLSNFMVPKKLNFGHQTYHIHRLPPPQSRLLSSSCSDQRFGIIQTLTSLLQSNPICTPHPICQEILLVLSFTYIHTMISSLHLQSFSLCPAAISYHLDYCSNLTGISSSLLFIHSHNIHTVFTLCYRCE